MDCKKPTWATGLFSSAIFFLLNVIFTYGQTEGQKAIIRSSTNSVTLSEFIVQLKQEHKNKQSNIKNLLVSKNWKYATKEKDGTVVSLNDLGTDGTPLFYTTFNDPSEQTSRAHTLYTNGLLDLGLDGDGMTVGVWDAGVALTTHQEFGDRVKNGDGSDEIDAHGTLVTGNLVSTGIKAQAQGVAYAANAITHNWTRDKIEVAEAAANGLLLSNHSYGIKSDRVPDWYFGAYIRVSQDWDKIMYNAPYYLMVTAAGNSQQSMDNESPIYGKTPDGFDLLLGFSTSKNGLTVAGAYTEIGKKGELKKAEVAAYSSLGPVDDGRIKPDLAGDGSSILSTSSDHDKSYQSSFGTSMAAPGVTGSLLLLQQYHDELYGNFMKAATLKGLALHTADDVAEKGPDYKMGWGVMNAKSAAELLQERDYSSLIAEEQLADQETFTLTIDALPGETLYASISWTDPEGTAINRGELNDGTAALTNDLDIRITQNGTTYFPWKLNPVRASDAAIQGDNRVDPYERIEIPNAEGSYEITISHKGALTNGYQDFSLILSGVKASNCSVEIPKGLDMVAADTNGVKVNWDSTDETLYELQYKAFNEAEWTSQLTWNNEVSIADLSLGQIYEVRIRAICTEQAVSEFSDTIQFEFKAEESTVLEYEVLAHGETFEISIYPNPAVDRITVDAKLSEDAVYSVVTTSGNIIKKGNARGPIDVSCLSSGLYVLVVQDHAGIKSTKFYKS
ncbi:S8 family serine peptidase [Muricauda sp. 2012CJ35-5]|uniref:S8 family serine peptidase n=1 Tax=Flagellimonas spongiicola TaxID=2942208 RepID=A0ABT0PSN6_9FLAO|nr:S8 family serine peptidase [Allomuricauda spongiicola]MCL6274384.1 S8 family serine peptidase [Allomuricauda spongiicola]